MRKILQPRLFLLLLIVAACKPEQQQSDAYGNFEATEVIVSAEASGKLINFEVEEGQTLKKGQAIGLIDTLQLSLKMEQIQAMRAGIASRTGNIGAQVAVLKEQRINLLRDRDRFEKMLQEKAATPKQLDDINGQLKVTERQIQSITTQNGPVLAELRSIDSQLAQLRDQIQRSIITSPIEGTVLIKYAENGEVASYGKPLFKVANLSKMILRAYVSGDQLASARINQAVKVLIDNGKEGYHQLSGRVTWIASEAEFTPKIIQTKEERVNLVYAMKVEVSNDGRLKIGMPGEVVFQ